MTKEDLKVLDAALREKTMEIIRGRGFQIANKALAKVSATLIEDENVEADDYIVALLFAASAVSMADGDNSQARRMMLAHLCAGVSTIVAGSEEAFKKLKPVEIV